MFWASAVPIIRSYLPYAQQLVRFVQVMWRLPSRVRLELRPLNMYVEISQDVTVKRYVELLSWRPISTSSVPLMPCITCTVKAKTRNIPDTVLTSETNMMFLHPTSPSTATIQVCSFHQQLHNSCEIQHDHNEMGATISYVSESSNEYGSWLMTSFWHLKVQEGSYIFLKIFKPPAIASCTLNSHLQSKTNDTKSGVVLRTKGALKFYVETVSKRTHQ
jgi:hypothetical protein